MTYKSIIQILIILAIISTICIGIMKPKMHKPVMVYNSEFNVEHDDGFKIDEKNIAVMVQDTEVKQEDKLAVENNGGINFVEPKIEDITPVTFTKSEPKNQNIGLQNQKVKNTNNTKLNTNNTKIKTTPANTTNNKIQPAQTKVQQQPITNNQPPKIDLNKIVSNNQKIINTPTQTSQNAVNIVNTQPVNTHITAPKPSQTQPAPQNQIKKTTTPEQVTSQATSHPNHAVTVKTETKPIVLTAAQEEIAWNKWRSNLNNQIMKDSKLPTMPNGIIFKYKFTVDKYGKISNVQTSSTTSGYTPYAIQFIAPVIRSYQGRAILNFPYGSKREYTEVSGAWRISNNSKLSTPDDYHDIEKVKK